jgi:hypothetical protein
MFKSRLIDIEESLPLPTQGRTFYVCQAGTEGYEDLVKKVGKYRDGTEKVYTTIQAAITAAVSNRGDQILVMPDSDDYDSATTITVNKSRLKIIAPFGIDEGGIGANNSVRLHATGDVPVFTVNAAPVTIAGFFMKCATDQPAFTLATGLFHVEIHHNYIGGATADGDGLGLIYTAGYTNHASIHHNYFDGGYAAGSTKTIAGAIVLSSGSNTRNIIENNVIVSGTSTTLTVALYVCGVGCIVRKNDLFEYPTGTFSEAIKVGANVLVIDNHVAMETGNIANALVNAAADLKIRNYGTDAAGGETILT